MRDLTSGATTVIALATELHAIATGNMVPSFHVTDGGIVRPVYFYSVDMSEFAVTKLANRGLPHCPVHPDQRPGLHGHRGAGLAGAGHTRRAVPHLTQARHSHR